MRLKFRLDLTQFLFIFFTNLCWVHFTTRLIISFFNFKQVNNHFPIPMDLLCKKEEQFSRITTIQPDSVFSVPLMLAHKAALYLRPAGFGYAQKIPEWYIGLGNLSFWNLLLLHDFLPDTLFDCLTAMWLTHDKMGWSPCLSNFCIFLSTGIERVLVPYCGTN